MLMFVTDMFSGHGRDYRDGHTGRPSAPGKVAPAVTIRDPD